MKLLETQHLTKKFGTFTAVDSVSLTINAGERFALIGNNGAGKTTLMKMLTGLLIPDSGTAAIAGHDVAKESLLAKKNVGYMSDDPSAYDYLTGEEFLILTGRLRNMSETALQKRLTELTSLFPIQAILPQPMSRYSRGNKQKVAFLAALMAKPKLLIIDEPIVGLDSASIEIMGETLTDYTKQGNGVLFVTHIVDFAKRFATKAGIMSNGKLLKTLEVEKSTKLETLI